MSPGERNRLLPMFRCIDIYYLTVFYILCYNVQLGALMGFKQFSKSSGTTKAPCYRIILQTDSKALTKTVLFRSLSIPPVDAVNRFSEKHPLSRCDNATEIRQYICSSLKIQKQMKNGCSIG